MNQRRRPAAAAPRGATPRVLSAPSSSSSSRQQQQRYTAADIDREIAASNEDDDDNDENDDDDDDVSNVDDDAGNKVRQKKRKAAPRKIKQRKSGYKQPTSTKKPKIKQRKQKQSSKKSKRREEIDSDDESDGGGGDESDEVDNESDDEYEEEDSEISNEDESEEDGDDDSDYGTSYKTISTRSKKNPRGVGGKRRTIPPYARSTTNTTRSSPARSSRRRNQRHPSHSSSNSSDDDDDDSHNNEGTSGASRGRGRPRRACKTQTELRMSEMVHKDMQSEKEAWGGVLEEDDRELLGLEGDVGGDDNENRNDDDEAESNVAAATNGRHASPKKSSKRTGIHDDDDDEDYDDAPSDTNNGEDDDDEGVGDDDNDDDDDLVTDDEIVSKQNQRRSSRNRRSMKNVDLSEEEIGTADEDSEDEETGPGVLMSPARKSSASRIGGRSPNASRARASARMGRKALDIKDDDDGEAHQSAGLHSATSLSSRKDVTMESLISCPSTTDEITMANLPKNKPHVCYISPDGRTRHCFALDTLYRIAISAANNRIGGGGGDGGIDDIINGSTQKLTFLQPPHFRSPMEDDLLDQIASRFGRAALNIEKSAIYKRMHGSIFSLNDDDELDDFDEDGEFIGYGSTIRSSSRRGNFQDRFERYIQSLMGSNDVYCCPLCYNEADRRLGNMGDEEMWEDDDDDDDEDDAAEGHKHSGEDCFSFMDDPMRILGSLDQDHYEVASTFCFRTLVDVKTHLKIVHQVNIKEVAGNDLYHRFQIRASDGLLQSWLKRNLGKTTVQGDMMRYWNQGENQSFVLLLSQIDKGVFEGEISGEYGSDFCLSFPNRAKRIWREVSAPYLKDQHDMGDFIAAEGEEESEEDADEGPTNIQGNSSLTPQDTPGEEGGNLKSPEDQIIEFLQKKQQSNKQKKNFFKGNTNDSDNDENNSSDGSSDDDELEVLPKPQQYEEVEEEDEWIKSKHLKAKKRQKRMKSSRSSDEDSGANVFDSGVEIENPEANGSARKRIIDDDNSLGSDTADGRPNDASPTNNNGGSARKKVIESSDEESF